MLPPLRKLLLSSALSLDRSKKPVRSMRVPLLRYALTCELEPETLEMLLLSALVRNVGWVMSTAKLPNVITGMPPPSVPASARFAHAAPEIRLDRREQVVERRAPVGAHVDLGRHAGEHLQVARVDERLLRHL